MHSIFAKAFLRPLLNHVLKRDSQCRVYPRATMARVRAVCSETSSLESACFRPRAIPASPRVVHWIFYADSTGHAVGLHLSWYSCSSLVLLCDVSLRWFPKQCPSSGGSSMLHQSMQIYDNLGRSSQRDQPLEEECETPMPTYTIL